VKLGADAGLTVATIGAGANASMSTAYNADILTLSKSQGLYGGVSVSGSVFGQDNNAEQAYYGAPLDSRQIVVDMQGHNPGANPLRQELIRFGG
jgi:lipid-binding SYLF domain-containing protein